MTDKDYLILLSTFTGFGSKRTLILLDFFKSAKKVWNLTKGDLINVGIKEYMADYFVNHRRSFDAERYFEKLKKLKISCVSIKESAYPENLKTIDDPPFILYVLGKLSATDKNAVAIIGSRRITPYGREMATLFARYLAIYKITIVSGLALGVDAVAQKAAIDVNGKSIAVIASGLDNITPYSNIGLAKEIVEKGGAIVSEMPLGASIFKYSFPLRNRIISGLSGAVLVVEGAKKSGTLLTASHAANQGRTVFAIPGEINSPLSEAPMFLLKNGARIATSPKDILDEMDLEVKVEKDAFLKTFPKSCDEEKIYKALKDYPLTIDEIVRITGMGIFKTSNVLMNLKLEGLIEDLGGMYKKIS